MSRGNRNPSPSTRFGAENANPQARGRRYSKDKLSQDFLKDLQAAWEKHGAKVLEDLAQDSTGSGKAVFAKIAASMEPKEIEHRRAIDSVDDDKLAQLIALLQAAKPDDEAEGPMIQ